MSAKWVPKSRAKRNVCTNYSHPTVPSIETNELLYLKRMAKIFEAMQQTIQEAPGIPQMQPKLRPLATSVVQAWAIIEKEINKLS